MNPISSTTGMAFQQSVVNSIRLNLDTKAAICLYTNNNSKRSTMIAIRTPDFDMENNCTPNSEQKLSCGIVEGHKSDQKFFSFWSVLN